MDKIVKLNHRLKRRPSRQASVVRPSRADAEDAVRTLIRWAGDDPDREGLVGTPARVARAYEEWFAGYFEDPREYLKRTFEEVAGYDEIVLLRDIRFESHCEHHMAPIIGRVHIGYLPRQRLVGISKLVRLVEVFWKRLRVQEKMTAKIAACLDAVLKPFGVGVVAEAAHECMTTRGVHKSDVTMVTSCMLGTFRTKAATRQEFLSAINLKGGAPSGNAIRLDCADGAAWVRALSMGGAPRAHEHQSRREKRAATIQRVRADGPASSRRIRSMPATFRARPRRCRRRTACRPGGGSPP